MVQGTVDDAGIEELRELYAKSSATGAILNYFASWTQDKKLTVVDTLLESLQSAVKSVSRSDVIEVFRELDRLRFGRFVVGRRGKKSRFRWRVSSRSVGQAARGTTATIEAIPDATQAPSTEPAPAVACRVLAHTFQLRPTYQVRIELPPDMTNKEAARLAEFIRALPFERE